MSNVVRLLEVANILTNKYIHFIATDDGTLTIIFVSIPFTFLYPVAWNVIGILAKIMFSKESRRSENLVVITALFYGSGGLLFSRNSLIIPDQRQD